jgi:hypothetical protein
VESRLVDSDSTKQGVGQVREQYITFGKYKYNTQLQNIFQEQSTAVEYIAYTMGAQRFRQAGHIERYNELRGPQHSDISTVTNTELNITIKNNPNLPH